MECVKIFLASSVSEFSDERIELKDFTRRLADALIDHDVRLRLFICEYADNAIAAGRMQMEYNKEIDNSDLFLMLVGQNLGEYTLEEYEYALSARRAKGSPKIIAAFRRCGIENEYIAAFAEKISAEDADQITFETTEELKAALASVIAGKLGGKAELRIGDGRITVNGKTAARL